MRAANTFGLVLCGGQSSRMGTDKSMLVYHDKPQRYHVYDMLHGFCEKVFISCRHSRAGRVEAGYLVLADDHRFKDCGPMAALLTAFERFPGKDILLIGCDYPFLTAEELSRFISFLESGNATAFYNEAEDIYEPLLAWYPYSLSEHLQYNFSLGQYSLKHFLQETGAVKFHPGNKDSMRSVDTKEEFVQALARIKALSP